MTSTPPDDPMVTFEVTDQVRETIQQTLFSLGQRTQYQRDSPGDASFRQIRSAPHVRGSAKDP